ncbi:MAG TPA: universal stress protein [Thermomicrobiaceae bacterium]|nr:universal stress protein [Thermomicrobiaceae bacterium]
MAPVFTKILLATDGADDARLAARAAADLAGRSGAELHLVHAWSIAPPVAYPYELSVPDLPQILEDNAREILAEEGRQIADAGGKVTQQHLLQGRPAEMVVDLSQSIGADLIVVGSRGHGAVGRLILGSVAEGIVRCSRCPILVVRGGPKAWPPTRLVIGTDGSPEADQATELALTIAVLIHASLLMVRVLPALPLSAEVDRNVREAMIGRLDELLARNAETLRSRYDARLETLATFGSPARVLIEVADTDAETLLVVGSRGLGRIARLRLGSVSNDVLHAAHCPVLIVPPKEG